VRFETSHTIAIEVGQLDDDIGRYEQTAPVLDQLFTISEKYGIDGKYAAISSNAYTKTTPHVGDNGRREVALHTLSVVVQSRIGGQPRLQRSHGTG
jgi:hypothetical protein